MRKTNRGLLLFIFTITSALFMGCSDTQSILHVWFGNTASDYAITGLYLQTGSGSWSTSYIPDGEVLSSSQYMEFDVELEPGERVTYYLTVNDGATDVALTDNPLDQALSILYWSSSTRYVEVTVKNRDGQPVVAMEGGYDYSQPEFDSYTKVGWQ
ncbi:hypothetical protein [Sphaerochaeta sp.]|uniref:hypothetical protein n=1 Tax=Sphaerochaeta sp. TaxID=1972642 RepID=UPI002FC5B44F